MNKLPKSLKLIPIFFITFMVFILTQIPFYVKGSVADSTPQSYLPVMLGQPTATPDVTPTATATPTSTFYPTATPTATIQPSTEWLDYVNWLRSLGELPAVTENTEWSYGNWLHARYMVKNDYIGHYEDPANQWYTDEGAEAAASSDVMVSGYLIATDIYAIDLWMSGPFHGLGIIDPALTVTGFGSYREAGGGWEMGACLDVIRGLGSIPPSISFPLFWPGIGGSMPYTSFTGGEWPDPLSSCSGYTTPSGPPIYLQIGSGNQVPSVSAHSFQHAGSPLDHCVFDETNYTNLDPDAQDRGRAVLNMRDAIVLMPRDPLVPGFTYTVSITNSGTTYTWSFIVTGTQSYYVPNTEIR
jgi:uncharacterized protein YkwD